MNNPPIANLEAKNQEEPGLNSRQRREIEEMVKNLLQEGLTQVMNELTKYTNPYKG